MLTKTMISISSFICLFSQQGFAFDDLELFQAVARSEKLCVERIKENKIYLKTDKLHAYQSTIYLELDHDSYLPLQELKSDSQGYYIQPILSKKITKQCPVCGREYLLICPNDNCPTNQKKKKKS